MRAVLVVGYGLTCYALFLLTFLCAIGFVGGFPVPRSIDTAGADSLTEALIVDTLLLGLFAVQHSVMARQGFKRWWTRIVSPTIERSTFVLAASFTLILLFWQWRPIAFLMWHVTDPSSVLLLHAVFWLGWAVLLTSTFLINHFELFGLRQVFATLIARPPPPPTFRTPMFYRYVRHPIYLGFLMAFWAAPTMTLGHLLFSIATSGYILIGIFFEERDLIDQFGDCYRNYRDQVGMLLPRARKARHGERETQ